jgi:hypothetical protein
MMDETEVPSAPFDFFAELDEPSRPSPDCALARAIERRWRSKSRERSKMRSGDARIKVTSSILGTLVVYHERSHRRHPSCTLGRGKVARVVRRAVQIAQSCA